MFGTSLDLDDADAVKNAENMVQQRLYKPWRNALHYGKDQEMMHSCTGWFLGRNILQIDRDDTQCTGPGMSALNATPCPLAATHNPLCLCAVGMLLSALVDQSGRPIRDQRNVNLLEDDLEEVINTSKTRTDGARAQLETWDESASTAYKERLRKNLQYIIEHKERWTIIAHKELHIVASPV